MFDPYNEKQFTFPTIINFVCFFYHRGAFHTKNRGLTKEVSFDVPTHVLSYMMKGQVWPDGDELYHRWLNMPTLLLHGKYDKFITIEEEIQMSKVRKLNVYLL